MKSYSVLNLLFSADCQLNCNYCYVVKQQADMKCYNAKLQEALQTGKFAEQIKNEFSDCLYSFTDLSLWGGEPFINGKYLAPFVIDLFNHFKRMRSLDFSSNFALNSDIYKQYCLEMAELAKKGVWSTDAINDTSDAQAYFENGTSGAFVWNTSVYSAGKNLESSKNGTYAVYDVTPDTLRRRGSYADDATAITASSKNPKRAALVLDYIKSDVNLNRLLLGGIEGEHWELTKDGYRKTLDAAENYTWNGWAWALNRQDEPDEVGIDERQVVMDEKMEEKEYHPEVAGFTFDPSNVETEYTVVQSVLAEYESSFALGIYGDQTEKMFDTMKQTLESAGLSKVTDELLRQYEEYLAKQ